MFRSVSRGLILSLSWTGFASAEDPQQLPAVVVEESRIPADRTATEAEAREEIDRTPGGVEIVGEKAIERTRAQDLKDALEFVPGVYVQPRGLGEEPQLSIRGSGLRNNFHTRGVNVLLDGFPFQNADGFSDVESFELLATRRVEVFKGANSIRFGANTLGGAINFVTRTGRDTQPVESRIEGGSFGYLKSNLSSGLVRGPWDTFVGLSDTRANGYRRHSESERQRAYSSVGYQLDGGASVRLDGNYVRNREDLPGSLTLTEFRENPRQADAEWVRQDAARDYEFGRLALTVDAPLEEDWRVTWFTGINYQDLYHPLPFAIIDNNTLNGTTELRVQSVVPVFERANRFTAGLQLSGTRQPEKFWENDAGNEGVRIERRVNSAANFAGYLHNSLALGGDVSLVTGVRAQTSLRKVEDKDFDDAFFDTFPNDSGTVTYFDVSPSVGLLWDLAEGIQLYGNASRMVEPPLLLELTAPGNVNGTLDDLKPQKGWQFELGTRGAWDDRVSWDFSIYDIELKDEIRNLNVDPTGAGFFTIPRYSNIDRSRHWGVELGSDVTVVRNLSQVLGLSGDDRLHVVSAYNYSRFNYVDDDVYGNNDLPGVPIHFFRADLRYDHSCGFWIAPGVEAGGGQRFVNSENTEKAPGYTLMNVRLGYDHEPSGLGAFFEARNVFDRQYVAAVVVDAADGRSFDPGSGRAFYGGFSWKWR